MFKEHINENEYRARNEKKNERMVGEKDLSQPVIGIIVLPSWIWLQPRALFQQLYRYLGNTCKLAE